MFRNSPTTKRHTPDVFDVQQRRFENRGFRRIKRRRYGKSAEDGCKVVPVTSGRLGSYIGGLKCGQIVEECHPALILNN